LQELLEPMTLATFLRRVVAHVVFTAREASFAFHRSLPGFFFFCFKARVHIWMFSHSGGGGKGLLECTVITLQKGQNPEEQESSIWKDGKPFIFHQKWCIYVLFFSLSMNVVCLAKEKSIN